MLLGNDPFANSRTLPSVIGFWAVGEDFFPNSGIFLLGKSFFANSSGLGCWESVGLLAKPQFPVVGGARRVGQGASRSTGAIRMSQRRRGGALLLLLSCALRPMSFAGLGMAKERGKERDNERLMWMGGLGHISKFNPMFECLT
jgi:hypothetical protein